METLKNAVRILSKRPSILILTIILSTIICVVEYLFVILFFGITMLKTASPFDAYINIIQFVINTIIVPETAVKIIIALVFLVLSVALIFALLLSGYFNILNRAVSGKSKERGSEFILGVKKYFLRMVSLNLWTLCSTIIFIIYVLIASIPAAIFIDNALNGEINIVIGVLFFILTILVLFFSYAFFRQYIVFWYPSALIYEKNHFKMAKKISNINFWGLLSKFIVLDIVLVLFDVIYITSNFSNASGSGTINTILLVINIIFKTIYIALVVCFVFDSFKKCNDSYQFKKKVISK